MKKPPNLPHVGVIDVLGKRNMIENIVFWDKNEKNTPLEEYQQSLAKAFGKAWTHLNTTTAFVNKKRQQIESAAFNNVMSTASAGVSLGVILGNRTPKISPTAVVFSLASVVFTHTASKKNIVVADGCLSTASKSIAFPPEQKDLHEIARSTAAASQMGGVSRMCSTLAALSYMHNTTVPIGAMLSVGAGLASTGATTAGYHASKSASNVFQRSQDRSASIEKASKALEEQGNPYMADAMTDAKELAISTSR